MTEHQLSKANRLKDGRDEIQNLINFLTDHQNGYRFGLKRQVKYGFFKRLDILNLTCVKEFSNATKEVIINALIKQRDNLTKQIEEL